MSQTSTVLSRAHLDYIAAHARPDDPFLVDLLRAAEAAGLPSIAIAPEQARFIQLLLRLADCREVVEVGTLAGYSAINMARALPPGGRVRTVEADPAHAAFARDWIARSDVAERVEVFEGRGLDVLPSFASGSADAAFIDADKVNYANYLEECLRILRPGGLVLADNALGFGRIVDPDEDSPSVQALRAFNDLVAARPDLEGVIVPLGDGLWVATRG
ncbi:MAG: O-methyltransferase [Planctomycetota bacterium]|nr:MAG: O-methyltransferase [Planctomycetota bacterium]